MFGIGVISSFSRVAQEKKVVEDCLAKKPSPYLQEHSENLVSWYPWAEEAFAKAKKENKPIVNS